MITNPKEHSDGGTEPDAKDRANVPYETHRDGQAGDRNRGLRLVALEGRRRIEIGSNPKTIRVLREELDQGVIPDTYVHDGRAVVLETVSGTGDPGRR